MNFTAGIHVLIKKGDEYLLIKRSENDDEDKGAWDLPGGGIDGGEQPQEAAKREAQEEAGTNIKVGQAITYLAIPYKGMWSIELIVEGEYLSGEVKLSEEHDDYKWVSKEELTSIEPRSTHLKWLIKNGGSI